MSELLFIPVDQIHSTGNVRLDEQLDEAFMQSIVDHGIRQPINVEPNGEGFNLVDGHRRLAAARAAGLTQVPAFVTDPTDAKDRTILQLVSNLQRQDLDPIEEALAFSALSNEGVQQKEIAERVGVTQPHVSKRVSLLKLSDSLQNRVRVGTLDVNLAVELAKVRDHAVQEKLASENSLSEHRVAMALKRQKEEDNLAKFIKQATSKGAPVDTETDLTGYRRLEDYATYEDLAKANLPEDAIVRATTDWDGKPCLRAYVPTYGNSIEDPEAKDEKKVQSKLLREATKERESHLKTIVAKAGVKDVTSLAAAFLFDRLVTANSARKISVLLDLDPAPYAKEEPITDYATGEVKSRKTVDYTKLVTDWYNQGPKESVQALMAAIVVHYEGQSQLEEYLVEKGVPTIDDLLEGLKAAE